MIILVMVNLNLKMPTDHFSDSHTQMDKYKKLKEILSAS